MKRILFCPHKACKFQTIKYKSLFDLKFNSIFIQINKIYINKKVISPKHMFWHNVRQNWPMVMQQNIDEDLIGYGQVMEKKIATQIYI